MLGEDLNFSLNFVSWSNLMNPVLGGNPAQLEFADPGFFVDDPAWGSLLGFPGFTQIATGISTPADHFCLAGNNDTNDDISGPDLATGGFNDDLLHSNVAETGHVDRNTNSYLVQFCIAFISIQNQIQQERETNQVVILTILPNHSLPSPPTNLLKTHLPTSSLAIT